MPFAIGTVLENRYRIDALLGAGGMGAVYRAWDGRLHQDVAIKENALASPASARQFEREARMMARLRHPNLARVIDHFVTPAGVQYLVMDYVEGEDLGQIVKRVGPLDEARALAWIDRACDGLTYLHSQDPPIIHRDIKPSNIKITPRGEVYLVDFGIAKIGDAREHTTTGALGVTPGFSPPEQYGTGGTDERSDVYALGATLYALLTGESPPESVQRTIRAAALTPPQTLRPGLSASVASAVEAALETAPTDRPQTVAAFQALLRGDKGRTQQERTGQRAPRRKPSRRPSRPLRPTWAWGIGVAALALVAVLVCAGIALGPQLWAAISAPGAPMVRDIAGAALGDTRTRPTDGMVMVYVPAGEFDMGSDMGSSDEQPVHSVALDGFWIDRTEVTNAQYGQCEAAGACGPPAHCTPEESPYGDASKGLHPVICVDWGDAERYCEWAGGQLPTEAEWEYAARGPDGPKYPWGNSAPDCDKANYERCVEDTAPVGSHPAGTSWSEAQDMAGNVWEWAADWYDSDYYGRSPARNPTGPSSGEAKAVRGGSWNYDPDDVRGTDRDWYVPDETHDNLGFRCASRVE